ncbi:MAG: hypothetical protein VX908_03130 [Planctomycetota bacterium]|nr:hypothetical protein [Planctomycetota bacterium]
MLFTGEYEYTIDAKQRLAIPSDLRGRLDPRVHGLAFYIAPGQEGSLWLWPELTFEAMAMAGEQSLIPDEELLEYEQLLYSQATRVDMDKAGRIRIPERMLKLADLGSSVVVLGVKDHLEVRDPQRWEQVREKKFAQQAEIMLRARRAIQKHREE